ncbi:hypothetical protein C4559_04785 [Candidatus Microgenomates bacterium]|nr:MAG: hypothetical protein C4559_04785 [Candidatus Microgenomates bacterium]
MADELKGLPIKFTPLDLEGVFGDIISETARDGFKVTIRNQSKKTLPQDKIEQLQESAFQTLRIGREISPELGDSVTLFCGKNMFAYMGINGTVSEQMLRDEADSQIGAMLHELVENLQEDRHFALGNNEGLPDLVEFLFTGESRVPYFAGLNRQFVTGKITTSYPQYVESWKEIIDVLAPDQTEEKDPDKLFEMMLKKRALPEQEKIQIVKQALQKTQEATKPQPSSTS